MKFFSSLLFAAVASKTNLNILTINDVHLDLSNEQEISGYDEKCSPGLLKTMLEDAKSKADSVGGLDIIMLVGDNCKHGMSPYICTSTPNTCDPGQTCELNSENVPTCNGVDPDWEAMEATISAVVNYIKNYFPDIPILPTVGNNDVKYHDQVPSLEGKADYY